MASLTPFTGDAWTAVRISSAWSRVRREIEAGLRLKVAEGRLLWLLRDGEPRTLRQIAEGLGLEQSTVNRQVHAALDSGVVHRFRGEGESAYLIDVTDEGRERFRADAALQRRIHEHALRAVPDDARADFLAHLEDYVTALGEAAARDEHSGG